MIPSPKDLPEIQDTPFRNKEVEKMDEEYQAEGRRLPDFYDQKGEVSVLVDEYNPTFVGAYESITGMKLNIYVDAAPGHQEILNHEFNINPESIEFILKMITNNIEDAPDTPTKDAIIQNLADMRSGGDDRLYQVVFDMSNIPTCFDAEDQLIRFAKAACAAAGVTSISSLDAGSTVNIPILINSGIDYDYSDSGDPIRKASRGNQSNVFAHEIQHGISGAEGNFDPTQDPESQNTYKGDLEHGVIDWIIGDRQDGEYKTKKGQKSSPNIGEQIEVLTEAGRLKPIVELKE